MGFVNGLPLKDFHYALLWTGEYDRLREGFPTWSWAGRHAFQQWHMIYPLKGGSGSLVDRGEGYLETCVPDTQDLELQGLLISLTERPHLFNRYSQQLAHICMSKSEENIRVTSETTHFFLDILPDSNKPLSPTQQSVYQNIPFDFDSTINSAATWGPDMEYKAPYDRFRLRDCSGNIYKHHYPRWYNYWPPFLLNLPSTLRGNTLTWLLCNGIRLIKIIGIDLLEGADELKSFNYVLCLGFDSRETISSRGRRLGVFCIPKHIWDRAGPSEMTVTFY
ncbi:hypothetical protein BDV29DRAFT_34117 [Aspergillus leporis]|uniref:Uncharacterized protein n=1 Tax=Aspergillus leporis TaxID=41062 RepID=A0A5N5WRV4_9EURO|nr:hypothetical protein BDV29DRAFT_34117 [Aspergillus leporis]